MSRRQLTYVLGLLALAIWGRLMSVWVLSSARLSSSKSAQAVTSAVGHALVDPDESVRTRAQELLEAVLARR